MGFCYVAKEIAGQPCKPQKPQRVEDGAVKDEIAITLRWHDGPDGVQVLGCSRQTAKGIASALMYGLPVQQLDEMSQAALFEFIRIYGIKARMTFIEKGGNPHVVIPSVLENWNRPPRLGSRALVTSLAFGELGEVRMYLDFEG